MRSSWPRDAEPGARLDLLQGLEYWANENWLRFLAWLANADIREVCCLCYCERHHGRSTLDGGLGEANSEVEEGARADTLQNSLV